MTKKRIIAVVLSVIMLFLSAYVAVRTNEILMRKTSRNRMQNLIEGETNKDILFVGTSHIMDGVIPAELWNAYGLNSYVLCGEYNDMDRNVPMLRLALQYTKPSLVVLDVDNYWEKSPAENTLNGYHEYADAFPLTPEKIKTTLALYPDKESRTEILFPILRYHDRWKDLSRGDFRKKGSDDYLKGYEFSADVQEVELYETVPKEEGILLEDAYGVTAIESFIDECRNRGIEVLLVTIPFSANAEEQAYLQGIHRLAEKKQVAYLNLIAEEGLVSGETDFRDEGHLNVFGAEKITEYIGAYIQKNYDVPVRNKEIDYLKEWDADYLDYQEHKENALSEMDD